jgi:hypothetical protein
MTIEVYTGKDTGVVWGDCGWIPNFAYGFVPDEKVWKKALKFYEYEPRPYPTPDACCSYFPGRGPDNLGTFTVLVTMSPKAEGMPLASVIGLLTHEAAHIWQQMREHIGEDDPSSEFEAYAMQAIIQSLWTGFEKTRSWKDRSTKIKR